MARLFKLIILLLAMAPPAWSGDRDITVVASPVLVDSGLMRFMLPRFSLKTGVRVHLLTLASDTGALPAGVNVILSATPPQNTRTTPAPALKKGDQVFFLSLLGAPDDAPNSQEADRFAAWLLGDIGQRVVDQFAGSEFASVGALKPQKVEEVFDGNIMAGEIVSYKKCGRCHVIGERNRMQGIGSTPSFGVVRTLPDWAERFRTFYARAPHPSVTQVQGKTKPFDISRPPSMKPVILSRKEYDDMLAYVATIKPADLGAPLQGQ